MYCVHEVKINISMLDVFFQNSFILTEMHYSALAGRVNLYLTITPFHLNLHVQASEQSESSMVIESQVLLFLYLLVELLWVWLMNWNFLCYKGPISLA